MVDVRYWDISDAPPTFYTQGARVELSKMICKVKIDFHETSVGFKQNRVWTEKQ